MSTPPTFDFDPAEVRLYGVDWQDWLLDGETVVAAEWTIPDVLEAREEEIDGTECRVLIAAADGETPSGTLTLECSITTSMSQETNRKIRLRVKDR